jgi:hypothetical protein
MKTIQVYYIYVYDHVRSWVKVSYTVNPADGFEFEEQAITALVELSNRYPLKEYTIMSVWKTKPSNEGK